jgi:8-amino-7-oxononanoate synthase
VTWPDWLEAELLAIRRRGQWRTIRTLARSGPETELMGGGTPVVSFASNDYLGLSTHPATLAAAHAALTQWGSGAGASRLVVGSRPVHDELEAELARWKGTEATLLFPTGYAANLGVLSVLGGPEVTIYSDELNHASIIDGCRLASARVVVYRHGDMGHLADLLADDAAHHVAGQGAGQAAGRAAGRALVVSDTVFSMDGDVAQLDQLFEVCTAYQAMLILDEAHAVLGPHITTAPPGLDLLRIGTLSKTLGAVGGFVAGPRGWIDLFINRGRPFIFSTAPTPADTAAALAAVRIVQSPEGTALIERLRHHVDRLQPGHLSPIIPVILGSEERAIEASAALLEQGLLVPAIRPPTVPAGTSRLRVALSAAHTDPQIAQLQEALDTVTRRATGAAVAP